MEILARLLTVVGFILVMIGFSALDSDRYFIQVVGMTLVGFLLLVAGLLMIRYFG
jgi:hypothetical protein